MKHQNQSLRNLLLAAMFLAIGLVLPFFTGQIKEIGNMLLPMHLPVFLCALICGWQDGTAVGFIMPLLRFALFSMPRMPTALAMAFEMATYAFVAGFLYSRARWQCTRMLYRSLIIAMIAGRIVWAAAMIVLLGLSGGAFTWQMFISGAFLNAIPGIILQLVLIPAIMVALDRAKLVPFRRSEENPHTHREETI